MSSDPSFLATQLTREMALGHPRLNEFWWVNDQILQLEEVVSMFERAGPRRGGRFLP